MVTSGNMTAPESPLIDLNVTSFDREYLHWSFIILEVAAVVVIVIGDISMLMMFFTRKLLGQSTNILVFSVAIGDLLAGIMALPLAMMQKILVEPSDFLCKGYFYFSNVSKTAVGYTILLLAMERIIALLIHTFRILPPGRCLFFASLTWFFSAAYNIWSVVIYDVEVVTLASERRTKDLFLCFASSRFMYLHDIFEVLNPLVTFIFPALSCTLLFIYFVRNKQEADKPGRPYKSSKSVVIFTLALLVSFVASHLHGKLQLFLKILHLLSFSRGFWDIFIFGGFRHYVCKKEKALAHFREQRSLQVQRTSLAIPFQDRGMSTSLLDSDPSVSRRYSSDISRRASALDDISCQFDHNPDQMQNEQDLLQRPLNSSKPAEDLVPVVTVGYLIPRSPCASDNRRQFIFPPDNEFSHERKVQTNRGLSGKSVFGSCEAIQEISEDGDFLAALSTTTRKPLHLRRKSCGDKASHLLKLNLHRVARSAAGTDGGNTKTERNLGISDHNNPSNAATKQTNTHSLHDNITMSASETQMENISQVPLAKNHNYTIQISKSAEKLSAPFPEDFNREIRRNTLNVPSTPSRRGSSCKYLTVPSTMTPFIPRSPCATD
ncbi:unnamed protein product [Candidula unifasciata]|uniref:G-protein coupled receptors family 1 profile domain-containing protein n=1 Tax=Candidula unifasciata TaxID=100452 RepID=A0A8S3YW57_9EUPU|nr:unnamed protein product [Candidula unifasciata]